MSPTRFVDVLRHMFDDDRSRPERNPDECRLESLDDWILFGPRMR